MTNYTNIANHPKAIVCEAFAALNVFCYRVYICGGAYYTAQNIDSHC